MLLSREFSYIPRLQSAAMNAPPLNPGERGESVQAVQRALRDSGYELQQSFRAGIADGIYGSETKRAVGKFQEDQQLIRDGIAGKQTLHKLDELLFTKLYEQSAVRWLLKNDSKMQCPHGGTVTASASHPPFLTENDPCLITGCRLSPHPCHHVRWAVANDQIKIGSKRTLNVWSIGICLTEQNVATGPVWISQP